jgi:hypothetical protein
MRLRPLTLAVALVAAAALVPTMLPAAPPPPKPLNATVTPPPADATATPFPTNGYVAYSGRLLDLQQGFVFFSSGDGFQMAPTAKIVDAVTGGPTTIKPAPRVYAKATFDKATKQVVQLALSHKPIAGGTQLADVQGFAEQASPTTANPDLAPHPGLLDRGATGTGRDIPVVITVQVPQTTPLDADVYIATDVSTWNPRAIRMDRIDASHYRLRTSFKVGTIIFYKYTRGDWNTAERTPTGLDGDPHKLDLSHTNANVANFDDTVEHWADDNLGNGNIQPGPQGIPTPYNPGSLPFAVNGTVHPTPPPARRP